MKEHNFLIRYSQIMENEIKKYGLSKGWDLSEISAQVVGNEIKLYKGHKKYLKFVDKGTKPFLMYALQGKIIPIEGGFRFVDNVGLPGYTYYERNGIKFSTWRDQRWRHPGIRPQHFIRDAREVAENELQDVARELKVIGANKLALSTILSILQENKG